MDRNGQPLILASKETQLRCSQPRDFDFRHRLDAAIRVLAAVLANDGKDPLFREEELLFG